MKMQKRVNLFLVGFPKSGTTSYANYLSQHPDIRLAYLKEPHFFSKDFHKESDHVHSVGQYFRIRNLDQYHSLYKYGGKKYYLDASTSYIYSRVAINHIYQYNHDAKVIVMLRNPVDFVYSWYNHLKYYSEENAKSLAQALAMEPMRTSGKHIPPLVKHPTRLYYRYISNYLIHLRRLFEIFPSEQIKIILLERVKKTPLYIFQDTLKFLELADFRPNFIVENSYQAPRFRRVKTLMDKISRSSYIKKIIPVNKEKQFRNLYRFIFSKKTKRPVLDPNLRVCLEKNFEPMVNELSQLLKIEELRDFWF